MGTGTRLSRRALVGSTLLLAVTGCRQIAPPPAPRKADATPTNGTNPAKSNLTTSGAAESDPAKTEQTLGPKETVDTYFSLLSQNRYDEAKGLITPSYQKRLGSGQVESALHSFNYAHVTDMVDAVDWANGLGAHLPAPPDDKREYLVTLSVQPTPVGSTSWSAGTNRRFIDVVQQTNVWRIDAIGISPGVLITGKTPGASASSPTITNASNNTATVVIPPSPLRLGPAPVDRTIYTARQNAVDRGLIPWAIDPIQVVHRDGPSFGIKPSDAASLLDQGTDPVTLEPQAEVLVHHDERLLLVTLEQPIKSGPQGIWAITALKEAPPTSG